MRAVREQKVGLWLPVLICLLLAGMVWLGVRQYEAQQRASRLFQALRQQNIAAVQRALQEGANPNSCQPLGQAPTDLLGVIKQLFLDALHPVGSQTALAEAVELGNPQLVRLLLNHGAVPDFRNSDGSTALMAATGALGYGTSAAMRTGTKTWLHIMQLLLDKGADVNASNRNGNTALAFSAKQSSGRTQYDGRVDVTIPRFLLEHGANANVTVASNDIPLLESVVEDGDQSVVPLVSLLLDHGANVNAADTTGATPLLRACEFMEPAMAQTLLKRGANPNVHSNDGMTPLNQAISQGQTSVIKLLLEKGADVNDHSSLYRAALLVAMQHKRTDLVKLLLDHGANPNYASDAEEIDPALVDALSNDEGQYVKLLLTHGANVNLGGRTDTPLTAAVDSSLFNAYYKRHNNIFNVGDWPGLLPVSPPCGTLVPQMLLHAGADANKPNGLGDTALLYAVAGHNAPLVRLLLTHGANPNVPGSAGETPISLAAKRGYSDLTALLQENPHSVQ